MHTTTRALEVSPSRTMLGQWQPPEGASSTCTLITIVGQDEISFCFAPVPPGQGNLTLTARVSELRVFQASVCIEARRQVAQAGRETLVLRIGATEQSKFRPHIHVDEPGNSEITIGTFYPNISSFYLWAAFMLRHGNLGALGMQLLLRR